MTHTIKRLLISYALVSATWAYNITFYVGDACLEEAPLGTFIGGKGQGCRQDFVGVAQGALVTSTGSVDDSTLVQFYSSNDCSPGSETSMTSAFCAAINGPGIGNYGSFQVVDDIVTPSLPPTITIDAQALAAAESSSSSPASAIKRRLRSRDTVRTNSTWRHPADTDSHLSVIDGRNIQDNVTKNSLDYTLPSMYHGKHGKVDGIAYRWHQVYDSGYVGVPASEWDPVKHKMDVRTLEEVTADSNIHSPFRPPVSPNRPPYNALEERAFDFSRCEFEQVCAAAILKGIDIALAAAPMIDTAKVMANKAGKVLWEFLNTPFVASFTAQVLADRIGSSNTQGFTTVIQITGPSPATIETCSATPLAGLSIPDINEQLASVIKNMASTTVTTAQTLAIAWSVTGTLVVSPQTSRKARRQYSTADSFRLAMDVISCGSDFSGQLCGLTTGLCEF